MNKLLLIFAMLFFSMTSVAAIQQDDFVTSTLSDKILEKPVANLNYNYEDTVKIPIKLAITQKITSEKNLYEGQVLKFRVAENVHYNNQLLVRKGRYVTCHVETVVSNGMNGIPASVVLGNFKIPNVTTGRLDGTYEKFGRDLSLLVFPLKWALTILPPTGSLTNFITGGHVKFKPSKPITIYYYPNQI